MSKNPLIGAAGWQVLRTLSSEGCKIYSLTITEFGYTVPTSRGDMALLRAATNAAKGPWGDMDANAKEFSGATALGMIVAGLQARRSAGSGGATVLSCDNIPGNGGRPAQSSAPPPPATPSALN